MHRILAVILMIVMLMPAAQAEVLLGIHEFTCTPTENGATLTWKKEGTGELDHWQVYAYYTEPCFEVILDENIGKATAYDVIWDNDRSKVVWLNGYLVGETGSSSGVQHQILSDNILSDEFLAMPGATSPNCQAFPKPEVEASVTDTTITLNWPAVEGTNKYRWFLKNISDDYLLGKGISEKNSITFDHLNPGTEYRVALIAVHGWECNLGLIYGDHWYTTALTTDAIPQDADPYVSDFFMSHNSASIGEEVEFNLFLNNASEGDMLTVMFCADDWTETFDLIYPEATFKRAFSQAGLRNIQFKVTAVNGEAVESKSYALQTLNILPAEADGAPAAPEVLPVENNDAKIKNVSFTPALPSVVMEKAEGETITATVVCNNKTGVAELYVGNLYQYSSDYSVVGEDRIFSFRFTLGGNGKGYAGEYKVATKALKDVFQNVDDSSTVGTLTVQHNTAATAEDAGTYYKTTPGGHTLCQRTKIVSNCTVCGYESSDMKEEPAGKEEMHTGLKENGTCSVCGYRGNIFETIDSGKDFSKVPSEGDLTAFVVSTENPDWSTAGKIRYVEQWDYNYGGKTGFDGHTYESYWGSDPAVWGKLSNGKQQNPTNLCTRAAASAAISYLGKDVLPRDMKDEFSSYYETSVSSACCKVEGQGSGTEEKVSTQQFIQWYNDYASDTEGVYSPICIRSYYWNKTKKTMSVHAFTIIGRDSTNPNCFYIADPGTSKHVGQIILQDIDGELRIAEYIGAVTKVYSTAHLVTDIWRYTAD